MTGQPTAASFRGPLSPILHSAAELLHLLSQLLHLFSQEGQEEASMGSG